MSWKSSSPSWPLPCPSPSQQSQVFRVDFPSIFPTSTPFHITIFLLVCISILPGLPGPRLIPPLQAPPGYYTCKSNCSTPSSKSTNASKIKATAFHPRLDLLQQPPTCFQLTSLSSKLQIIYCFSGSSTGQSTSASNSVWQDQTCHLSPTQP